MKESKSLYNAEKENGIFATRLRTLFEESKKTQQDLIDFIRLKTGKAPTRQAVSMWLHGNSPDIKTVPIIANFFGVSTDYLLTDKNVRTTDPKITEICDYTGLSENAVKFLHDLQNRAKGDIITPRNLETMQIHEQIGNKYKMILEKILTEYPELNDYLQHQQTSNEMIWDSLEIEDAFDEAKRCLYVIETCNELIEKLKGISIDESQRALKALSEMLSASNREAFVYELALYIFADFKNDENKMILIQTSDKNVEDFHRSFSFPSKIIDNALLSEIQNYIRSLKTEKTDITFDSISAID